jgi:hypothetical protein
MRRASAEDAFQNFVTLLLQSLFDFCKYCARTNPTWRLKMAAKKKAAKKAPAKKAKKAPAKKKAAAKKK